MRKAHINEVVARGLAAVGQERRAGRGRPGGDLLVPADCSLEPRSNSVKILLIGLNHRTTPVEVRERFAVSDPAAVLQMLADSDEIEEAVLLSTCNRVEIVVTTHHPVAARRRLLHFLKYDLGSGALPPNVSLQDCTYEYQDGDAVAHVFRVASSIDSMVVGEPQILGQVKDAYSVASEAGVCGPLLAQLFQRAFATAKRIKNETRIGERSVSIPRVAATLAGKIFEQVNDKTAIAATDADERRCEGDRAEQIVVQQQQRFDSWLSALQAVPTIRDLRDRAEGIRVAAIERAARRLGLDEMREEQRAVLEMLTNSIVNKLLHCPIACLRAESGREENLAMLAATRALFELDDQGASSN